MRRMINYMQKPKLSSIDQKISKNIKNPPQTCPDGDGNNQRETFSHC